MDKNQKIITILLIVAIVFSVLSIVLSIGISNLDLSKFVPSQTTQVIKIGPPQKASIGFTVESPPGGAR